MQKIYPGDTKAALEVFQIYEAEGEYFDISDPSHVVRDPFVIGKVQVKPGGYFVGQGCIGCRLCYSETIPSGAAKKSADCPYEGFKTFYDLD